MARRSAKRYDPTDDLPIRGAKLEPIRVVERELTRPDGTTLVVKVPVYPPFRLEGDPPPGAPAAAKKDGEARAAEPEQAAAAKPEAPRSRKPARRAKAKRG